MVAGSLDEGLLEPDVLSSNEAADIFVSTEGQGTCTCSATFVSTEGQSTSLVTFATPDVSTSHETVAYSIECPTPTNLIISTDSPLATPLTSKLPSVTSRKQHCKGCNRKAAKLQNPQRMNRRLKKNVSKLKQTIQELQSVSMSTV